mmetsp:Transcript_28465/g.56904  ORF Transcript_28465/g.56904 Transcript_28465/m.56904 type:complete len:117 (-) Transcript_28465:482-832(-)
MFAQQSTTRLRRLLLSKDAVSDITSFIHYTVRELLSRALFRIQKSSSSQVFHLVSFPQKSASKDLLQSLVHSFPKKCIVCGVPNVNQTRVTSVPHHFIEATIASWIRDVIPLVHQR